MRIKVKNKEYELQVVESFVTEGYNVYVKLPNGARTCGTGLTKADALNDAVQRIAKNEAMFAHCVL